MKTFFVLLVMLFNLTRLIGAEIVTNAVTLAWNSSSNGYLGEVSFHRIYYWADDNVTNIVYVPMSLFSIPATRDYTTYDFYYTITNMVEGITNTFYVTGVSPSGLQSLPSNTVTNAVPVGQQMPEVLGMTPMEFVLNGQSNLVSFLGRLGSVTNPPTMRGALVSAQHGTCYNGTNIFGEKGAYYTPPTNSPAPSFDVLTILVGYGETNSRVASLPINVTVTLLAGPMFPSNLRVIPVPE